MNNTLYIIFLVTINLNFFGQSMTPEPPLPPKINLIPESVCAKQKKQALDNFHSSGFTFDLIDSLISKKEKYIDSIAKVNYKLHIERHKELPYEICGTAQMGLVCYFETRDSIYTSNIGPDYLNRLIEQLGVKYDKLNNSFDDNYYYHYPDSSIKFNSQVLSILRSELSKIIPEFTRLEIKITSKSNLTINDVSFDLKKEDLSKEKVKQLENLFDDFKTNLKITSSATINGLNVNSVYTIEIFVF